jgi:hypothetical protein
MDPVTLGIEAVGIGLSAFGAFGAASKAKEASQVQVGIAQDEQRINAQKQQAMELSARRQQLEILRNTQRARAQGLNSATKDCSTLQA